MDSFEINKIIMAFLLALLIAMVAGIVAEKLVHPKPLAKNVYVVEGIEAGGAEASTPGEVEKAEPIEPLLASANVENGQKIAQKCLQCHTLEKGGPNKIGPNLWGIIGAKHGHKEDFSYSQALLAMPGNWDVKNLNQFLYKPRQYISGTKMSFAGLKKAQDRADLIAYLNTLSDSPKTLQ